jgi:ESF2/ABP1 family protein
MPPYKRKLDMEDSSDDEGPGYNSEGEEPQKGGRRVKWKEIKVAKSEEEDFSDNEEAQVGQEEQLGSELDAEKKAKDLGKPSEPTRNLIKNLVTTEKAIKKSGVVYVSRIPPFMKPHKLRSLLEKYGTINRIFLAPEDPAVRTRRVCNSCNKRKLYTEGWAEFVNKKDAKGACELLNARVIGGKKSSYYHDDVWNLRYLKGFKWNSLTEQIAAENAERASRIRIEISKQTKEDKDFVRNVEKAKIMKTRQSKAMRKGDAILAQRWTFDQIPLAKKRGQEEQLEQVKRALKMIF